MMTPVVKLHWAWHLHLTSDLYWIGGDCSCELINFIAHSATHLSDVGSKWHAHVQLWVRLKLRSEHTLVPLASLLVVSRGQTLPGRKGLVQCLTWICINTPQIIGGVISGCGFDWHSSE